MQLLRYCVGLDISKDSLQVCLSVIDADGRVVVKGSTKVANKVTTFGQLVQWVTRHRKLDDLPLRYVMESTGVYHEAVAWFLYQHDQAVSILLPNKAKHYLKSLGYKSKNDKIDAQGLARMGLEQQLTLWKPLSKNIYSLRMLTRQHQRFQELKTQCRNQQHALDYSALGDDFLVKQNTKLLAVYDQQLEALERAIQQLIKDDEVLHLQVKRLIAIKGLALLSVAVLIAETNGFEGFTNQRQLVSYAGYDVIENQSGNRSGKTRISKKGNSRIRRILHLPAFNAVRFGEPTCQALFERVYQRTNYKMKAYVAVQKKLLLLAYAVWRHEVDYNPSYFMSQSRIGKKIVPTSGTTQDQSTVVGLSFG
ncbi:IS110 family RNA-guided transposase [Spirosoma endophyticum]|uniref:Transposase n=1 Tax=Spirosoma endophyticum TaxID=662367 RepID=A0A1I2E7F7_9BACT|nr:IS110 family transposase [Spirosoma endophyticum]SFE88190.1 Transposase [Spirosoma endophyticum]